MLLAESLLKDGTARRLCGTGCLAAADDPAIAVRYQLAFTLGQIRTRGRLNWRWRDRPPRCGRSLDAGRDPDLA